MKNVFYGEIRDHFTYAVGMAGVTTEEDAVVESVIVGDTLTNWIDGVPVNMLPVNLVRLQDLLRGRLDFIDRRRLARVEVGVCRRCNLDVQANKVVFSRDDHDASSCGVDGAFCLL